MNNEITGNIIQFIISLFYAIPTLLILIFAIYYCNKKGWIKEGILLVTGSALALLSTILIQLSIFMLHYYVESFNVVMYLLNGFHFIGFILIAFGVLGLIQRVLKLTHSEN